MTLKIRDIVRKKNRTPLTHLDCVEIFEEIARLLKTVAMVDCSNWKLQFNQPMQQNHQCSENFKGDERVAKWDDKLYCAVFCTKKRSPLNKLTS